MRFAILLLLCLIACPVSAQVLSGSNADSSSSSTSASGSQSNNANNVNIISSVPDQQNIATTATDTLRLDGEQTTNFKTNTMVGLAASVSFSSDYCGGTASGGASAAGITIGAGKPVFDKNCQALRRAEKFGMAAVTAYNLGLKTQANKLQALAVWQLCVIEEVPQDACLELGLITRKDMPHTDYPLPVEGK